MKEPIITLTKKDFRLDYYRGSGKGGQHRNKTSSACRITHLETGFCATSEDERSQHQNRKLAFNRLCNNKKFSNWLKLESIRILNDLPTKEEIEKQVDDMIERDLKNGNIVIESYTPIAEIQGMKA